ncbi:MAG TPA: trypsin-like serine protease [Streptosporangiaceae bacterium]|jgi:V8-like Glu-specific endopeptidase
MTVSPLLLIAPLAGGLLAAPVPGHAAGGHTAPRDPAAAVISAADVVQHDAARTVAEQRQVLRYWTPDRMRRAKPLVHVGAARTHTAAGPQRGKPLTVAPARPRTPMAGRAAPARSSTGAQWTGGGTVAGTTGRVFLTLGGDEYFCSAGVVNSGNRDVVVTAGHCLKDGKGGWASKWTFVPGYKSGKRPYGSYTARRMFVAKGWSSKADDNDDIGMAAVNTVGGSHVMDKVGGQGIAFGKARPKSAWAFGYPADPPYGGGKLVYCDGKLSRDSETSDQGMRCDMTEGASGGPWLSGFHRASGSGTVVSVTSFKYSDDQAVMYGPYLGAQARDVYRRADKA